MSNGKSSGDVLLQHPNIAFTKSNSPHATLVSSASLLPSLLLFLPRLSVQQPNLPKSGCFCLHLSCFVFVKKHFSTDLDSQTLGPYFQYLV